MGGTKEGGLSAAKTNKTKYGSDFYKRIGAMGGKKSTKGGFAAGAEGRKRASYYGRIGGMASRKGTKNAVASN